MRSIAPIKESEDNIFSISELFHANTKVCKFHLLYENEQFAEQKKKYEYKIYQKISKIFKEYPNARKIRMKKNCKPTTGSLEDIISKRRSIRHFSHEALSIEELSKLLYYSYGITGSAQYEDGSDQPLRAAPSGGALYPLEIYLIIQNVRNVSTGVYHYNIRDHLLELLEQRTYRESLAQYCLSQDFLRTSSVVFLISAVFERTRFKYGERGYRYILLEAGHLAQNIYLVATSLNLGAATVAGFIDDEINEMIDVDGVNESVIYLAAIGKIKYS